MYKKPTRKYFAVISLLISIPRIALANAGSPMMWFGMAHSLVFNGFIGIIESVIITKFKIQNRAWLIIMGNYVSMIVGLFYIAPHFSKLSGNVDFWGGSTSYGNYALKGFFAGMVSSYIATLFIEFPFFYFAVKERMQRKLIFYHFL